MQDIRGKEIKIAIAKAAVDQKHEIFTNKLEVNIWKKAVKTKFLALLHMLLKVGIFGNYIKVSRLL